MTIRHRIAQELFRRAGYRMTPWNIIAGRMPVWGAHFLGSFSKARCLWRAIEKIHGKGSGVIRHPLKHGDPYWRVARRPVK